jgi:ubiquinol oxidase
MKKLKTHSPEINLNVHHVPQSFSDHIAYRLVKFLRFFADTFFSNRYGHRAVVLETVAGVPGMVGGMLQHLKSLRQCSHDDGRIKALLEEAENERMHLMTFIQIAQPSGLEKMLIVIAQIIFFIAYFILYLISPKTSHRFVSYLEEEAVYSYTQYLHEVESGKIDNVPAPSIAVTYWTLGSDARLSDVIIAVRKDEAHHRDQNHHYAIH